MVGHAAVAWLFLILPAGLGAQDDPAGVKKDPWIGLHRDELIAELGQPRKVKQDPQGNEVLIFRFRWPDRFVPPGEARVIVVGTADSVTAEEGPTHPPVVVPARGGFTGKKSKVIFYLDALGRVTRYEVKAKRLRE